MWPPKIPKCPKPLTEFFGALIERHNAGWPIDGFGIKFVDTPSGRSGNATTTTGGGASAVPDPLTVQNASSGTTPKISVTNGVVYRGSSWIPLLNGTALNVVPAPTLTVGGTATRVYLHVVVDTDGIITAVTIEAGTSVPASTDTNSYFLLATIIVTTGASASVAVSSVVTGSRSYQRCGYVSNYVHYFDPL